MEPIKSKPGFNSNKNLIYDPGRTLHSFCYLSRNTSREVLDFGRGEGMKEKRDGKDGTYGTYGADTNRPVGKPEGLEVKPRRPAAIQVLDGLPLILSAVV